MESDSKSAYRLCDDHIHLNMSTKNPMEDLIQYIKEYGIEYGILILNTSKEFNCFTTQISNYKILNDKVSIAIGLNKNDNFINEGVKLCNDLGQKCYIKLHPRLFGMNSEEMQWYIEKIRIIKPNVIIVDDFLYGCSVEYNLNINIICIMAKTFPDINIIMAHAGGVNLLEHIMLTRQLPNVYYDISLTCNYLYYSSIADDLAWLLRFKWDRVMLGSDYPDFTIADSEKIVRELFAEKKLPYNQLEYILKKNTFKVYKESRHE